MTNGDTLLQGIDEQLKCEDLEPKEALRLVLLFIRSYLVQDHEKVVTMWEDHNVDHPRVDKMWPVYRVNLWLLAIIGAGLIGIVFGLWL